MDFLLRFPYALWWISFYDWYIFWGKKAICVILPTQRRYEGMASYINIDFLLWIMYAYWADPCESLHHKGHLTFKLKYRWIPSYLLCTLLLFPLHLLPSPVHPTRFSFCFFFPGFLVIFSLLSSQQQKTPFDRFLSM